MGFDENFVENLDNQETSLMMTFGKNLKEVRKRLGLTQTSLAQMIGVSTSFVTEIEEGRKAPSFITIEKISSVTRVPVWSYFIEGGCDVSDEISVDQQILSFKLKKELMESIPRLIDSVFNP